MSSDFLSDLELKYIGQDLEGLLKEMMDNPTTNLSWAEALAIAYLVERLERGCPGLDASPTPALVGLRLKQAQDYQERLECRAALLSALQGIQHAVHHPGLWNYVYLACYELGHTRLAMVCLKHVLWINPTYPGAREDWEAINTFLNRS